MNCPRDDHLQSPATTCSTSSFSDCSFQHGEALFEEDDPLLQFCENDGDERSYSSLGTGEEIVEEGGPSEVLFWKEYELEVSKFCLSSSLSQKLPHSIANQTPKESSWGMFSFGVGILQLVLKGIEGEHRLKVVEKENKRLEEALAQETQRTAYYRNQVHFHREKSRELEWNLLNQRAEELQSRRPPS